ncbi:hypothetical protein D3C81_508740 [compost metagenome]
MLQRGRHGCRQLNEGSRGAGLVGLLALYQHSGALQARERQFDGGRVVVGMGEGGRQLRRLGLWSPISSLKPMVGVGPA